VPLSPIVALLRTALHGEGNLLSLLPQAAYRMRMGPLGYSRRGILIVNDPVLVRSILTEQAEIFPKSDLMVNALEPLIGDSMFVSSGEVWRRQRRMIDPAFTLIRLSRAFPSMVAGVDEAEAAFDAHAADGTAFSLDMAMSHLTADIICRTVFSTSLQSRTARDVFDAFTLFERNVAEVKIWRLIMDPAWRKTPQEPGVLEACRLIRQHLGDMIDTHIAAGAERPDDIAAACIAARDGAAGFSREELIDQLGVLFLAGHETTASALTWAFFILAMQPDVVARIRAEVAGVSGHGPVEFEHTKHLHYTRNVFRETLRLYPPITFLPRVALQATTLGGRKIRRGTLIMIAPWALHRHESYWREPNVFDPDRFSPERESELTPGAYIPFGFGPRVCVGAGVATAEATLILARLARRYEFTVRDPARVRPVARLTTRPAEQIWCRVARADTEGLLF
jgi:cytochrome P450